MNKFMKSQCKISKFECRAAISNRNVPQRLRPSSMRGNILTSVRLKASGSYFPEILNKSSSEDLRTNMKFKRISKLFNQFDVSRLHNGLVIVMIIYYPSEITSPNKGFCQNYLLKKAAQYNNFFLRDKVTCFLQF